MLHKLKLKIKNILLLFFSYLPSIRELELICVVKCIHYVEDSIICEERVFFWLNQAKGKIVI